MNTLINNIVNNYDSTRFNANDTIKEIKNNFNNLNTIRNIISIIRTKLLLKTNIEGYSNGKDYLKSIKSYKGDLLPKELNNFIYDEKIKKNNSTVNIKIHNSNEFIENILKGIDSSKYSEILPALILASGRQFKQLIDSKCNISIVKNITYFHNGNDRYEIQLLVNARKFRSALKKFRKIIVNKSYEYLNSTNQNVYKKLSKIYGIHLSNNKLKSIYACYQFNKSNKILDRDAYINKILNNNKYVIKNKLIYEFL